MVAMARVAQAEENLPGALDLLNEAERLYVSDFFPNVRPIPALRACAARGPGSSAAPAAVRYFNPRRPVPSRAAAPQTASPVTT